MGVDAFVTDDPASPPPPGMYWERCDHQPPAGWDKPTRPGPCRYCDGLGYYAEDIGENAEGQE